MLKTYLFVLVIGIQALFGASYMEASSENSTLFESGPVIRSVSSIEEASGASSDNDYLAKIESLGITLHPGSDFAPDDNGDVRAQNQCASLVYDVFQVMPPEIVGNIKNLTLYFNSHGRRGLGGGSTIILRCQNVSDAELVSVLVHEMGHVQDTGVFAGGIKTKRGSEFMDGETSVFVDDASLDFYQLSFLDESTKKKGSSKEDFVSLYAMTDPFEDFAETFNFYLLHGELFREMKKENRILQHKYTFMKEKVFGGQEFYYESDPLPAQRDFRIFDSTTLGYNLHNFLANK